jgi:LPXTG-site transpeptidase (sortase) family protein
LAGSEVTIHFRVLIATGLNPGVVITNQGSVYEALSNDHITDTDGDLNNPGKQPTVAVINGSVAGFALKTVIDKNGGILEPGDVLFYNIKFKNTTTYPALGLEFIDTIPSNTSYVDGSLIPPSGLNVVIVSTSPTLRITGIDVPDNSELDFSFEVQLDPVIPAGITRISNQGLVFYDSNGDGTNDAIQQTDSDLTLVGNQSTSISIVNIFDPPSGYKSVNGQGYPVLVWRQVWINDGNASSEIVKIVDSIPIGTTYSENSLHCYSSGNSVVYSCEYQPGVDQVVFTGIIGSDPGAVNENQAHNEVVIEFSTLVNTGILTAQNQGHGFWDQNGDGIVDGNDENVRLDQYVDTDNLNDSLLLNPTIWNYVFDKSNEPKSPATGFSPNTTTFISPQPVDKLYTGIDGMEIEIPKIGINVPIVGIPLVENNWDLTWLSDQVGYLYGSAYPTWAGNSYLTGHLTLPNGKPGPLYRLNELSWGDKVIIHAWGQDYTFEVRDRSVVSANTNFEFSHKDIPWITIVTCKDYDETMGIYRNRLIISAVLVKISN